MHRILFSMLPFKFRVAKPPAPFACLSSSSKSSLMTGRDTFRTGMQYQELLPAMPWGLPLDEVTLAERFKSAGYSTHMVS